MSLHTSSPAAFPLTLPSVLIPSSFLYPGSDTLLLFYSTPHRLYCSLCFLTFYLSLFFLWGADQFTVSVWGVRKPPVPSLSAPEARFLGFTFTFCRRSERYWWLFLLLRSIFEGSVFSSLGQSVWDAISTPEIKQWWKMLLVEVQGECGIQPHRVKWSCWPCGQQHNVKIDYWNARHGYYYQVCLCVIPSICFRLYI